MPDTATLNGSTPGTDDLLASVRTESRSLTLRELLNETPRVLLGVTTDAVSVLSQIEVDTVFDLATSSVFDDAGKLVKASSAFDSPLSQHGAPSADVVREGLVAGKPVGELQFMSIGILEKIPQNVVTDLKSALDVETVRDLAFYPPYRAAVRLMNAVYFPDNVAGIDLEQPRDLLPADRRVPDRARPVRHPAPRRDPDRRRRGAHRRDGARLPANRHRGPRRRPTRVSRRARSARS